jgi:hypothetical protein
VNGEPWWLTYRTPTIDEVHDWQSRSVFDFIAPTLDHTHRLIAARPDTPKRDFARALQPFFSFAHLSGP